jgi:hypothetical protein
MNAKYDCLTKDGKIVSVLSKTSKTVESIVQKAEQQYGQKIVDVISESPTTSETSIETETTNTPPQMEFSAGTVVDPSQNVKPIKFIKPGRTAKFVTDPIEVAQIKADHTTNGGKLSFNQIEEKYNLRSANGMTAYRIIHRT